MKKFFVYMTMAFAATVLLASCDDKNGNGGEDDPTLAEVAEGTYDVTYFVTLETAEEEGQVMEEFGTMTLTGKLVITELSATTVKLETKDMKDEDGEDSGISVTMPLVKLTGDTVKVTIDDECKLTYTQDEETMEFEGTTIEGSISPTATKDVISMTVIFQNINEDGVLRFTTVIKDKAEEE